MSKIKYSNGTRFVAFILLEILVVSACISAMFLGTANISPTYFKEAIEGENYFDSQYFRDKLMTNIYNASRFMKAKSDFELKGVYDGNKQVTIKQFLNDDSNVSEYSSMQCYKLQDLVDWSQSGTEYISINDALENFILGTLTENSDSIYNETTEVEEVSDTKLPDEDMNFNPENVEIVAGDDNVVTMNQDVYDVLHSQNINITQELLDTSIVKEKYTSVQKVTFLVDAIFLGDLTEIQKISAEFESALANISHEYDYYKENETYYTSLDSSNFKIYIQDNQGNIILNNCIDENIIYEDYFKNSVSGGIIYNAASKEFTFTDGINDDAYTNVESFKIKDKEKYIYAVGIDKNLAHDDAFLHDYQAYHSARISIIVLIASIIGILICFIYLVAVCGRSVKDDELHLNAFDNIKTEIGAGIMIALGIITLYLIESVVNMTVIYYGLVGGMAVETALFTIGFLSLAKRIKAGELWKNSLLYMSIKWIGLFFKYRKVTTKVAILYAGFSVITLGILGISFGKGSFLGLCVWFLFACAVGVLLSREAIARQDILNGIEKITRGELEYKIDATNLRGSNEVFAESINNIGEGLHNAVDASMRNERLKTDLITNVSHDIKTPLTSIINYVDLIKRENIDNEKIKGYIEILDQKSQRLKNLTEDLVEASKISSGNIKLEISRINFVELINQTEGEFSEKFEAKGLQVVKTIPNEPVTIEADGRRIWRVIENLYNNVAKYAMENTRVYVDLKVKDKNLEFSIKNISENPLNINADELTERFIRGDVSRSTEGSGLGLSIAKNLTTLQKGTFEIYLDGDLFRVTIIFPRVD